MAFKENLASLPEVQGSLLRLFDEQSREVAVIENAPGTAGSYRIYAWLAKKHGAINAEAALEGLQVYAEHTEDARLHPGKHPNIDRLIALLESDGQLKVRLD